MKTTTTTAPSDLVLAAATYTIEVWPVDGLTAREYRLPSGTGFRAHRKLAGRTVAYSLPCETEAEALRALDENPIKAR